MTELGENNIDIVVAMPISRILIEDRIRFAADASAYPPESIIADGSIHRCDVAGRNGKGNAAYLLHLDGIPAGGLENWRDAARNASDALHGELEAGCPEDSVQRGKPWIARRRQRAIQAFPRHSRRFRDFGHALGLGNGSECCQIDAWIRVFGCRIEIFCREPRVRPKLGDQAIPVRDAQPLARG